MTESDSRLFLDVDNSVTSGRWHERLDSAGINHAGALSERYGYDEIISRILSARGVSLEEAEDFLNPSIRDLMPDPSTLTDMDKAAMRLADSVERGEKVAIFGDYDVDGATSSALLYRILTFLGLDVVIHIPDRLLEGYGPNAEAIRQLISDGAELLVLVDCGSTADESLADARTAGIDIVVFDHHQTNDTLPEVHSLVNPNRHDDLSGQGHLCAVGVCYLAAVALIRALRNADWFTDTRPAPDLLEYLDLVALGTVCDIVPLFGINRAFVVRGLSVIRRRLNLGLSALCDISKLDGPVLMWHFGFILGPRINAGGRIGDAQLGVRLLTSDDADEVADIAHQLDLLNTERQTIERSMYSRAYAEAEAEIGDGTGPNVLVLTGDTDWHSGVVGLLASRLKDRFSRPSFAIAFDANGMGKGSGRSVSGIDLGGLVRSAVDIGLLEKGGGHAMAAGITVRRENLGRFRAYIDEQVALCKSSISDMNVFEIDAAMSASGVTLSFWDRLESAGPYGSGHSRPILAFPHHTLRYSRRVGDDHVTFTIASSDGSTLAGIAFRVADDPLGQALLSGKGRKAHFVGHLSGDYYRGRRRFQLRLLDMSFV